MTLGSKTPVYLPDGREIYDWDETVSRMDDSIRRELNKGISWMTELSNQEFFNIYREKHFKKYGIYFEDNIMPKYGIPVEEQAFIDSELKLIVDENFKERQMLTRLRKEKMRLKSKKEKTASRKEKLCRDLKYLNEFEKTCGKINVTSKKFMDWEPGNWRLLINILLDLYERVEKLESNHE